MKKFNFYNRDRTFDRSCKKNKRGLVYAKGLTYAFFAEKAQITKIPHRVAKDTLSGQLVQHTSNDNSSTRSLKLIRNA